MNIIKDYQKDIIRYLSNTDKNGILLYHSLQDNILLTSLLCSQAIVTKNLQTTTARRAGSKELNTIIVTTSLNIHRYISLIKYFHLKINKFELLTHKQFSILATKNDNYTKNKIVIIDKVHVFRNPGQFTINVIDALKVSKFNILSTTSLFINGSDDIISVIAMLHRISFEDAKELFIKAKGSESAFKKIYNGYLSYHQNSYSIERNYLKLYENIIQLHMDDLDNTEYGLIEESFVNRQNDEEYLDNPKKYLLDFQATIRSRLVQDHKIKWIINKIDSQYERKQKTIIYFPSGEGFLKKELEFKRIAYINIPGNISKEIQRKLITKFNQSTNINVLILSNINPDNNFYLPNVRNFIIYEPQLNNIEIKSLLDDISASFVFKDKKVSRSSQRRLDIFTLVSKKMKRSNKGFFSVLKGAIFQSRTPTVDEQINEKNEKSKDTIRGFRKKLKHYSI